MFYWRALQRHKPYGEFYPSYINRHSSGCPLCTSSKTLLWVFTVSMFRNYSFGDVMLFKDRGEGGVLPKPQSIIKRGCWFTAISWKEVNRHMKTDLIISIWLWNEKQMGGTWLSGPLTTWCTVGDEFDERCNAAWTRNRKRTGDVVSLKTCPYSSVATRPLKI